MNMVEIDEIKRNAFNAGIIVAASVARKKKSEEIYRAILGRYVLAGNPRQKGEQK